MRDIFTLIASFVRTQTRSPGVLWLRRKLSLVGTLLYARRKQIVAGLFVVAICGVYLGVSGTVFAQQGSSGSVGPTAVLPTELKKTSWWESLNPVTWALRIFNEILSMLVGLAGRLATLLISILMNIAQYNDFLSSSAVANGWVVTRDIANMFFIIILLVIAFGTILGSGEYNTKMLGKLLVMAVVINFSRTIIGIMIDASQIIMLTFVNGFSAAGAGNFINAFGVAKVLQFHTNYAGEANVTGSALIGASLLMGLVLMGVACWVLVTIVGTLLFRIAYLWFLLVLSPIAWLMSTFPAGKKYYAQWWDQFRDQLVVGPAMAFFLWLSLTAVGSGLAWNQVVAKGGTLANVEIGITQLLTSESILSFVITVVLLVASKEMAEKLAKSASGYGTFMKQWASGVARGTNFAKGATKGTLKLADRVQGLGSGIQFAKIPERFKEGLAVRTKKMEEKIKKRAAGNAAFMAKYPGGGLVAQYGYNWLSNPKMAIEKFGNGGLKGMWSRFRQGAVGTTRDKRWQIENPQKDKKLVETNLNKIEKDYKDAVAGLAKPATLQSEINKINAKQKVLGNDPLATDIHSKDFYDLAMERGWIKSDMTLPEFQADTDADPALGDKKFKGRMRNYARKGIHDLGQEESGLLAEKTKADSELVKNQTDWTAVERAYNTPDSQSGENIRGQMKKSIENFDKKIRSGTTAYVMGEMPYKKDLVRGWMDEEKDADKLYDWTKPANVIIDYFRHAGATGEERHQGKALKHVAEKGDIRELMEQEGFKRSDYKDSHEWVKDFTEKSLIGKYKWDREYAMATMAQVGEKESSNGNWDLASHIKVDAATGTYGWFDKGDEDHQDRLAKKFESMPAKEVQNKTNHLSLSYKDKNGDTQVTNEFKTMFARFSQDAQGIKSALERGDGKQNVLRVVYENMAEIEKLASIPEDIKKALAVGGKKITKDMSGTLVDYSRRVRDEWK